MSLPLYLTSPELLAGLGPGDTVVLDGDEGRHAAVVRRTAAGERLRLADGSGRVSTAEVTSVAGATLRLTVLDLGEVPRPDPRFVLVQALAKGGRDEQAIEAATELGVDEVIPWQAARSIVQWRPERRERHLAKWDAVLLAATKQSRRARRPVLRPPLTSDELATLISGAQAAFVLHEEAEAPLAGCVLPGTGDVLVIVGPEGGITAAELAAFTSAGGSAVRLGENVLRSSSAGPAALAVLNAVHRWR